MEQEVNLNGREGEQRIDAQAFDSLEMRQIPTSDISIEKEKVFENNQTPSLHVPLAQPVDTSVTDSGGTSQDDNIDDSSIADDVDVIEKAWVDKAKKIVEETRLDPYQQEKRANALTAEYIKKRYDKDIALGDN